MEEGWGGEREGRSKEKWEGDGKRERQERGGKERMKRRWKGGRREEGIRLVQCLSCVPSALSVLYPNLNTVCGISSS